MAVRALFCCLLVALLQLGLARDLKVPQQYATIQAAIESSSNGDRILVASGTYKGPGNTNIDFEGKAITVQGAGYLSTIIDGEGRNLGFTFQSNESASSVVRSITIKHCRGSAGSAVRVVGASPLFLSCSFEDCSASTGGAIYISRGQPSFQSSLFNRNSASGSGGAVYSDEASPILIGCTFDGNETRGAGGAIALHGGSPTITSCAFKDSNSDFGGGAIAASGSILNVVNSTFAQNTAFQNGGAIDLAESSSATLVNCSLAANLSHRGTGGIRVADKSTATIKNSILWINSPSEIEGKALVSYSCISGGYSGVGNIDDDPKLVDSIGRDLHLLVGSPCIDKANAAFIAADQDQDGRPRIVGSGPDLGAYEYPITKPNPVIRATGKTTFTVPHDGNPNTVTAEISLKGTGYDQLLGALAFQWMVENAVVGSTETLKTSMEKGQKKFDLQVRDAHGNFAQSSVLVTVLPEPNQAPIATGGSDQVLEAKGGFAHVVLNGHGYDADGDELTYRWSTGASSQAIALELAPGTHYFTFTVTDPYGAKASAQITVRVLDGEGPTIALKGASPMTVKVFSKWADPGATASDAMDGKNLAVQISGTINTSKLNSYTLTYSAMDSSGNVGSASRRVDVVDTESPAITLNGESPMSIDCGHGYAEPGATASDNYDGDVVVKTSGTVSSSAGEYQVTYTATDSSGNVATKVRVVTVRAASDATITLNGSNPMTIECATGYAEPGATAEDGCSNASIAVSITGTVASTPGSYTITYSATGSSGHAVVKTRTVIVSDTKPPTITLNGSASVTVECGQGYSELGAIATDACDGVTSVTTTGSVSSAKGSHTITYSATDKSGNKSTKTRTVLVADTTAPTITLKGASSLSIECGSGYSEQGATAADACDGTVSVTITGSVLTAKGSYALTYRATDSSGNSTTATRTVTVVDTTAPVLTLKGSNPMSVDLASGSYVEPGATATDTCDGTLTPVITGTVSATIGTYTITYRATNASGNVATATRTVNVTSSAGPTITGLTASPSVINSQNQNMKAIALSYTVTDPADPAPTITVTCTSSDADSGTFSGDLAGDIVIVSKTSVSIRQEHLPGGQRTYTITVHVTDKNGKTASASCTVLCK